MPSPWLPARISGTAGVVLHRGGAEPEVETIDAGDEYVLEVDAVGAMIAAGVRSPDVLPWEESLVNMGTLDRWRAAVGLRYAQDGFVQAGAGRAGSAR